MPAPMAADRLADRGTITRMSHTPHEPSPPIHPAPISFVDSDGDTLWLVDDCGQVLLELAVDDAPHLSAALLAVWSDITS